jgi:hypothetical protein
MNPFIYESTMEKGKLTVCFDSGPHSTRLTLTREEAMSFAEDLTTKANGLDRKRIGTAADLGCEVL